MLRAHASIAAQSRKSPSGARNAITTGFFGEAEPVPVEPAGEHLMPAGSGRRQRRRHVDRLLVRLGRIADRPAGEQPDRSVGQRRVVRLRQPPGYVQPVSHVDRAAQDHGIVTVRCGHFGDRPDLDLATGHRVPQYAADPLGYLRGRPPVPARRGHQNSHQRTPVVNGCWHRPVHHFGPGSAGVPAHWPGQGRRCRAGTVGTRPASTRRTRAPGSTSGSCP